MSVLQAVCIFVSQICKTGYNDDEEEEEDDDDDDDDDN